MSSARRTWELVRERGSGSEEGEGLETDGHCVVHKLATENALVEKLLETLVLDLFLLLFAGQGLPAPVEAVYGLIDSVDLFLDHRPGYKHLRYWAMGAGVLGVLQLDLGDGGV
jgi:hypothetical protein